MPTFSRTDRATTTVLKPRTETARPQKTSLEHSWKYIHGRWTDGNEVAYKFRCTIHPNEIKIEVGYQGKEDAFEHDLNNNALMNRTDKEEQRVNELIAIELEL
jgi:hypothetical protein